MYSLLFVDTYNHIHISYFSKELNSFHCASNCYKLGHAYLFKIKFEWNKKYLLLPKQGDLTSGLGYLLAIICKNNHFSPHQYAQ